MKEEIGGAEGSLFYKGLQSQGQERENMLGQGKEVTVQEAKGIDLN